MTTSLREWAECATPGVIFDFNGTLSRDEPFLLQIYTDMFERHLRWRLRPQVYVDRFAGRSDREIVEIVVEEHAGGDRALVSRLLDERGQRYRELVAEHPPITEESRRLVSRLAARDVSLGIVTGAQRSDVAYVLGRTGLVGYFRVLVTEEDVRHGKPHPEGFLLAADRLGLPPGHLLVFENSRYGVQAAEAAGMSRLGTSGAVEGTTAPEVLKRHADAVVTALTPGLLDDLRPGGDPAVNPESTGDRRPGRPVTEGRWPAWQVPGNH